MAGNRHRYEDALSRGAHFAWDGEWQRSVEQFEIARSEFPDQPVPYARLGQAYYELEDFDNSLRHYQQAARLDPQNAATLGQIADILERKGQLADAARIYMAVAEVHLKDRDLNGAISSWERATHLDADLLGARQRLSLAYERTGRIRDSIREHLALARIYQTQGNIPRAAAACKAALEMDPSNADVLAAVSLLRQGIAMGSSPAVVDGISLDHVGLAPISPIAAQALRSAAEAFEADQALAWQGAEGEEAGGAGPVDQARQAALADLAEIVFEEDTAGAHAMMNKADRDALISQAIDLQTRGEVDGAIAAYQNAIQGGVRQPAVHFNLGLLYQERVRLDEAIEQLQLAVDDPEYRLGSHFALGECYRAKGRLDEALTHFIEVAKIVDMRTVSREQAGDLVRLYESLADTYALKGEQEHALVFTNALVEFLSTRGWEDKVKDARQRLDLLSEEGQTMSLAEILAVPGSERLLETIALTNEYARRGWLDTALEECYVAIQLAPWYLPAHLLLANLMQQRGQMEAACSKYVTVSQVYHNRGDITRAVEVLERAVSLSPLDMSLRTRLVEMLRRHGEIDRALEHSIALAESYYQLAQFDKAREKYEEALQLAPRGSAERRWQPEILHRMADIDMQRLNWRGAVACYHQIVRMSPDDERANVMLVELLFRLGRQHEALAELDRFLAILASQRQTKKILAFLSDVLAQQPGDMGLLNRMAAACAQAGEREKAIQYLDRLGELQMDAGMPSEAANTIRVILSLQPANSSSYRQLLESILRSL